MPTIKDAIGSLNTIIGTAMVNFFQHPRTTISGILSATLTVGPILLAEGVVHGKAAALITSALATAKILWAGFAMRDPGTTLALTPGSPTPVLVPSHETPDSPANIPVVK